MAAPKPEIVYIGVIRRRDNSTMNNAATLELSKQFYMKSFNRFTQGNFKQGMVFTSQTVAERTGPGIRQAVQEGRYTCYAYGTSVGICGIVITNDQYPRLAAYAVLSKVVDAFISQVPKASYENLVKNPNSTDDPIQFKFLEQNIETWQKPEEVTGLSKIQAELDATKEVLHKTIESVLERGEKIDNLVAKSEGLSASSKMFYSQAKKQNSCCTVM